MRTLFVLKIVDVKTNNVINYDIKTFHKLRLIHPLRFRVMQVSL